MAAFFGVTLLTLLAVIAWFDVRERRVPNLLVVAIVALYALAAASSALAPTPLADLAVAAAFLGVGVALWMPGWLGGGDAKLLAALGLWAGPAHALDLAFAITVAGGLFAAVLLLVDRVVRWRCALPVPTPIAGAAERPSGNGETAPAVAARPTLPYAVAIATGAMVALRDVFFP